jgi:hypothetical protein
MFLAVFIAFLACVVPASAQGGWKMYQGDYFTLKLPPGFEVKKSAPVQDFEIFTVTNAGSTYAGIYVGNQPTFPKIQRDGQNDLTMFKAKDFEMISVWKDVQLLGREILIKLERSDWPTYLHVWTAVLPPDKLSTAEKIVSSVTIVP